MKASDLFIRCLENEGVEYIFGVPGEENADIMISLLDSKIRFIVCRHEQGAAFMSDVYGRLTGKVSACLGTLGPGASNLITGVGDANMDRAPSLVLTGQAASTRIHKESHQAMDLVKLFESCVKWGTSIRHPDSIPEVVRKACRIATTDKYGATHIDLPEDVAKMPTLAQPIPPVEVKRPAPHPDAVAEAVSLIRGARFPVILSGNGTLRNEASDNLRAFAREHGIPVLNTFMGKGAFPASDPLCCFTIGLGARDHTLAMLETADVVISVGFDMVEYHPKAWNRGASKTIVHVDQTPAEIDDNYRTSAELVGDIAMALDALNEGCQGMAKPDPSLYAPTREAMLADFHKHDDDTEFPVKPQKILSDVRRVLPDDSIILSDVGAHKMWIARYLHSDTPNTVMISNGWCSMGFALPGAIGAKLAFPDRKILAICGDGGVMMNIQDLETAVREGLKIVVMVWCDSQYGLIRWKQENHFGKHSHIDFTNPDWMKLADAFGMKGFNVERTEDLAGAIEAAFECPESALIAVPVDYRENMKLTSTLKAIPESDVCEALAKVEFFAGLPKQYRQMLAEQMHEVTLPAGSVVFEQGAQGGEVYLLHGGEVAVEVDGTEVTRLGSGAAFGEMAALSSEPRSATVRVTTDATLSVLDGAEFRSIVTAQPALALELSRTLAQRLARRS